MFNVKFEYRTDEEHGVDGWIPTRHLNFNAANGFTLVHDALEHFRNDGGDLNGEMRALGSMINIRLMSGLGINQRFSPESNIASDVSRFLTDILTGMIEHRITAPPVTRKIRDECVEDLINDGLKEGVKTFFSEIVHHFDDDADIPTMQDVEAIIEKMRGWMRIGYRQSRRRYHYADTHYLGDMFERMVKSVEEISGDFGDTLTISVSPKNLNYNVYVSSKF